MEQSVFDNVNFEKKSAIARFNCFRRIANLWQILEVLLILGLISWSSIRVPAALRGLGGYFVEFSAYLLNHHVVFLIGNAIIVLLFMLCRRNGDLKLNISGDEFYDDYVKHSGDVAQLREPNLPPEVIPVPESEEFSGGDEEKQIVVFEEAIPQNDDVLVAIEEATRQIKRFERTQSEKLKREIAVRSKPELRRSETENRRNIVRSRPELRRSETENRRKTVRSSAEKSEIESLSNEEFRRTVDAFIDEHWIKRKKNHHELLKME